MDQWDAKIDLIKYILVNDLIISCSSDFALYLDGQL